MAFAVVRRTNAEASADALVNAAGTSLQIGSGAAGALRHGANGLIDAAAVSERDGRVRHHGRCRLLSAFTCRSFHSRSLIRSEASMLSASRSRTLIPFP